MEPTIQRWSAKRKVELLLSLIKGEKKLVDVCREHDLKQSEDTAALQRTQVGVRGSTRDRRPWGKCGAPDSVVDRLLHIDRRSVGARRLHRRAHAERYRRRSR
jgi:hypothetical protein